MLAARTKGRGHYDRALTPSQRAHQHRVLIYSAVLEQLALGGAPSTVVNLDVVCRQAGLGRNTVYGLFESVAGLASGCLDEAVSVLETQLEDPSFSNTPLEGVSAF